MGYFHLSFQRTPPWVPSKLVYHQEYCFLIWSSVSVLLFLPFVSYIRLEQTISKITAWFQGWNPSFMQNPRAQRSTLYSHYPLSWFYSEFSIQIFGRRTAKAVVEPGEKKDNCHSNQLFFFFVLKPDWYLHSQKDVVYYWYCLKDPLQKMLDD